MTAAAILGCLGPRLRPEERAFFAETKPWGFILFARNLETPDQIRRLTAALRDAVGYDAPILIDQEGGRVQRIGPPHWRQWLPPLDQMALGGRDALRAMWLRARIIADELHALGIDVNCSPTCDIADDDTHAFLRNRCYGSDAATVTAAARAVADGLLAGGVLPVAKHTPGHGRAFVDSHRDLPVVGADTAALQSQDFAPFRALADLPMAMTAHIVYSALDARAPATTSAKVVGLIRDAIGFEGLLMTDDISMQALAGDLAARSRASIAAGCDVVLHCNGEMDEMQAVVGACGALTGAAADRAQAALAARRAPVAFDVAAAEAELAELLDGRVYG